MVYGIPDSDVAAVPATQSVWYSTDLAILAAGFSGTGVVSGCGVTQQGSPDMTVAVASGNILAAGTTVAVTSGNLTVGTADATNPRIDLISASAAGVKTITAGTAAASPKPPALPSGHIGLAMIDVPASATTITTARITDKRVIVVAPAGGSTFHGAKAYSDTTQSISAATMTAIALNQEEYDTDAFHDNSTNNTRMTVGTTGWYRLTGYADWAGAPGTAIMQFFKNGTTPLRSQTIIGSIASLAQMNTIITKLTAADYVECRLYTSAGQSIGDATNVEQQTYFSIELIGT